MTHPISPGAIHTFPLTITEGFAIEVAFVVVNEERKSPTVSDITSPDVVYVFRRTRLVLASEAMQSK